jgi:hypothetical protein
MKVEFELNLMGVVYLLVAVGLVSSAVAMFSSSVGLAQVAENRQRDWVSWLSFTALLAGGLVAVGLLVPVVRRVVKAFMP